MTNTNFLIFPMSVGGVARARCGLYSMSRLLQLLMVTAVAGCGAGDTNDTDHTYCMLLYNSSAGGALEVMVSGAARELHVWWVPASGGGAAARAHAALLAAALRRLRYSRVRMRPGMPSRGRNETAAHRPLNIVVKAGATVLEAADAGAALLLARLAATGRRCQSAVGWSFYGDANNLADCAFLRVADVPRIRERAGEEGAADPCGRCAALVTSRQHEKRARALADCARSQGLLVQVVVWEPLQVLPATMNYSVLFFEEPLWGDARDVYAVQPPHCGSAGALRLRTPIKYSGDDTLISLYAPPVFTAVSSFKPSASDIREVLRHSRTENNIEEAACKWTMENEKKLNFLISTSTVYYQIRLCLCSEDPERGEYEQMSKDLLELIVPDGLMIKVTPASIECGSDDILHEELSKYQDKPNEQQTVGWLSPTAGTRETQRLFEKYSIPLVAYGAPASGLRASRAVRSVAGSVRAQGAALAHLLRLCDARRLAVLAERTPHADELAAVLREDRQMIMRQRNVTSADGSIDAALDEFRSVNARVFFVNADAKVCADVVCAAERAGMAADGEYLWIVREWRGAARCGARALRPLSVGLAWRGAAGAASAGGWARREGRAARALDTRWAGRAWPPLAAPLADALLLLTSTLADFLRHHPESAYDRHVFGNAGNFANAVDKTFVSGITQELIYTSDTYELSSALVFVERWEPTEPESVPVRVAQSTLLHVWRVRNDHLQALYNRCALCSPTFRFRPSCFTTASGDPFAPKCHDNVWLTSLIVVILAPIALLLARRARLHRLKLRDLALLEQLLEQRKTNSSRFASCLVSRNEFELREELGTGAYGRVRAAVLRRAGLPALAVAAKEPTEERLQDEADLIREASVLFSLKHENIVNFVGVCLDGRAVFFMEYAFFGDLRHYLRARRPLAEYARSQRTSTAAGVGVGAGVGAGTAECAEAASVSAPALSSLARDAAAALQYLALQRIVHRDVRAANCLIDETRRLKLADFGLARHLAHEEEEYTWQNLRRLPAACMAPESLLHGVFSTASDIWALGVLLLELVTLGDPPYGSLGTAEIAERVRAGRHPLVPPDIAPRTMELLEWCWRHSPHDRPSAAQVLGALRRCPPVLAPALGHAPSAAF